MGLEVWWEAAVSTEQRASTPGHRPEHEVLAALGAINRVARALVGSGSLAQLAERALSEMRDAMGLELVVLYLPGTGERPSLTRFVTSAGGTAPVRARDEISFEDEAWRLAIASGAPLLFREEASWLVPEPVRAAREVVARCCRSCRSASSSAPWWLPPRRRFH